jgi:hypothetical protein
MHCRLELRLSPKTFQTLSIAVDVGLVAIKPTAEIHSSRPVGAWFCHSFGESPLTHLHSTSSETASFFVATLRCTPTNAHRFVSSTSLCACCRFMHAGALHDSVCCWHISERSARCRELLSERPKCCHDLLTQGFQHYCCIISYKGPQMAVGSSSSTAGY